MTFSLLPSKIKLPLNQILDKSLFIKNYKVLGLVVQDVKKCGAYMKTFDSILISTPRIKRIVTKDQRKLLLLDFSYTLESTYYLVILDYQKILEESILDMIKKENLKVEEYELTLDYNFWNAEEIFEAILPEAVDFGSSFETIGHIAHLNLRDHLQPYKKIIGQVLLDKNPSLKTIVTKVGTIESVFRTFEMEVLAGEPNFVTEVKENDCRFQLDFSKVYWNSRLHTEHGRLLNLFKKGQIICDVFAGIGPFAVPAAKKGALVYANDLNPESFKAMQKNFELNKIPKSNYQVFCLDGREFIRKMIDEQPLASHYVMNLPATAIEFLDAFHYLDEKDIKEMPFIHCHCFTRDLQEPEKDIQQRAESIIGRTIKEISFHHVRKVAPNKEMYCFSFKWPIDNKNEPAEKKRKLTNEETKI